LSELVFEYLSEQSGKDVAEIAALVARDYMRGGRSDLPKKLAPFADDRREGHDKVLSLKRQQRAIAG
jgi:hypothetical protein